MTRDVVSPRLRRKRPASVEKDWSEVEIPASMLEDGEMEQVRDSDRPAHDLVRNRVLFQSRSFSIYLVRYSPGPRIVPHVDMVSEGRLYKLNLVLAKPKSGGKFSCERCIFKLFDRVILFRPDLYRHAVTRIERGNRWLLSFALTRP